MNDSSSAPQPLAAPPRAQANPSGNPLLLRPILPTLVRLTLPNLLAMMATALVAVAETSYIGRLGTDPLAAMALVFPMIMLTQMMSAGAMGGGVSSAVSRALGAGDVARANELALHAAVIGLAIGLGFMAFFLTFGPAVYRLLGGKAGPLALAVGYSNTVFLGAVAVWMVNTLASVVRGTGNMLVPSATMLAVAAVQIVIGGTLGLGLGPFPQLGMPGVALGQIVAFTAGMVFLLWFLLSGRGRLRLSLQNVSLRREIFVDILKVGAIACLSPLQSVLIILIFTGLVARYGTHALAGYGIGARLEFLLIPIAFAVGVACVPMVGMAMGAGDVPRARRVAWTGGALAALSLGSLGILVAIFPDAWAALFTRDEQVLSAARQYLRIAGPGFGFFGLAMCLYFASQGGGKMLGPVLAQTLRLALVAGIGWLLVLTSAPLSSLFVLTAGAMMAYGVAMAAAVYFTRWGPRSSTA